MSRDVTLLSRAWSAHAAELVRYATLLVGPADAADVVSNVFVRCGGHLEKIDYQRGYLLRAVTTAAIDQRRSTRRRQARDLHAVLPTATDAVRAGDVDVRRAVAALSVQQRAVVYFVYWHDLTAEQTGELLGIAPATVRRHLARARTHLRKALT